MSDQNFDPYHSFSFFDSVSGPFSISSADNSSVNNSISVNAGSSDSQDSSYCGGYFAPRNCSSSSSLASSSGSSAASSLSSSSSSSSLTSSSCLSRNWGSFRRRQRNRPPVTSPLLSSTIFPDQPVLMPLTLCNGSQQHVPEDSDSQEMRGSPLVAPQPHMDARPICRTVRTFSDCGVFYNKSSPEPMFVESSTPTLVRPTPERLQPVKDDDDDDMEELRNEDTQDPVFDGSRTPELHNLPHPCDSIPGRSESDMCMADLDDETAAAESPFKVPRLDDCKSGSLCRSHLQTSEHNSLFRAKKGRLGALYQSTPLLPAFPSIPTPDFTPKVEEFHLEDVRGMKLMVKSGANQHRRISPKTAAQIIKGEIPLPAGYSLLLWDARFPFEYAGHIFYEHEEGFTVEAQNFTYPGIRDKMDAFVRNSRVTDRRYIILCYCEFSSARAPRLFDILRAAERDIMLEGVSNAQSLQTTEESRFEPLIIDGGFSGFYSECEDLTKGGYIREIHDPVNGPKCRSAYESDIADACASRILNHDNGPQPTRLSKKTRSFVQKPGFSIRPFSENDDDANVDSQETNSSFDSVDFADEEPDISLRRTTSENVL